jgi:hypothetical protein
MSRTATSTSSAAPPQNHLSAASLSNLLDRLKSLPANESGTPSQAELALYRDYAVDPETMSTLRRWVNSPSIDPEKTKIILSEQGEESVEMTASTFLDGNLHNIRFGNSADFSFMPYFIGGLGQLFCYGSAEGHLARSEAELRIVYRRPHETKHHYDILFQDMLQYSSIQGAALSNVFALRTTMSRYLSVHQPFASYLPRLGR